MKEGKMQHWSTESQRVHHNSYWFVKSTFEIKSRCSKSESTWAPIVWKIITFLLLSHRITYLKSILDKITDQCKDNVMIILNRLKLKKLTRVHTSLYYSLQYGIERQEFTKEIHTNQSYQINNVSIVNIIDNNMIAMNQSYNTPKTLNSKELLARARLWWQEVSEKKPCTSITCFFEKFEKETILCQEKSTYSVFSKSNFATLKVVETGGTLNKKKHFQKKTKFLHGQEISLGKSCVSSNIISRNILNEKKSFKEIAQEVGSVINLNKINANKLLNLTKQTKDKFLRAENDLSRKKRAVNLCQNDINNHCCLCGGDHILYHNHHPYNTSKCRMLSRKKNSLYCLKLSLKESITKMNKIEDELDECLIQNTSIEKALKVSLVTGLQSMENYKKYQLPN